MAEAVGVQTLQGHGAGIWRQQQQQQQQQLGVGTALAGGHVEAEDGAYGKDDEAHIHLQGNGYQVGVGWVGGWVGGCGVGCEVRYGVPGAWGVWLWVAVRGRGEG